jgi:hypothetical protein
MRLLVFAFMLVLAPVAYGQSIAPDLNADFTFFYRNPSAERAVGVFKAFTESPSARQPNTHPALAGFLAAVFQRYPETIDKIVPPEGDILTSWTVATALRLSGQPEKSDAIVAGLKAKGLAVEGGVKYSTTLQKMVPRTASDFDVLWGASFATGDPQYCAMIMAQYAAVAQTEIIANDLISMLRARAAKTDLQWVHKKYDDAQAVTLMHTSSALWSLASNARHPFVGDFIKGYFKTHADDAASKGLACFLVPDCNAIQDIFPK